MISAIAIISKNRGLGIDNHLLFHIPGELPRLKKITMGHPIIMGRKTYESIGHPLPGRTNIIITRDATFHPDETLVVHSLDEAVKIGKKTEEERIKNPNPPVILGNEVTPESNKEVDAGQAPPRSGKYSWGASMTSFDEPEAFILGGGQIFAEALPQTNRLYLTIVDAEVPADTFFPSYEKEFTKVIEKEEKTDWEYPYRFVTLER